MLYPISELSVIYAPYMHASSMLKRMRDCSGYVIDRMIVFGHDGH